MSKLSLYHKILIVIYIIAIPVPFGVCFIILIYSILYYVFKLPLKQEKYLLKCLSKEIKNYFKDKK
tara:strand:- start:767 stop:964 length:198 start_codon:yes stop_codon:yes gene_type:complete